MAYTTRGIRPTIANQAGLLTGKVIDKQNTSFAAKVAEGKYEHYSKRVQGRLDHISSTLSQSILLLEASGIIEVPESATNDKIPRTISNSERIEQRNEKLYKKLEELKRINSMMETGGDIQTMSYIAKDLQATGKNFAINMSGMRTAKENTTSNNMPTVQESTTSEKIIQNARKATEEGFVREGDDPRKPRENIMALNSLLTNVIKYNRAVQASTRFTGAGAKPLDLIEKIKENLEKIDIGYLDSEIINLLWVKEELEMNRMVGLRLSLAIGNQYKEAGEIAENYYLRYLDQKLNTLNSLGRSAEASKLKKNFPSIGESHGPEGIIKSRNEFMENEIKKFDRLLNDAQEYLKFHRRLSQETIKRINAANVRLFSLYRIMAQDAMSQEERDYFAKRLGTNESLSATEKEDTVNGRIARLVNTASGFGQRLQTSQAHLTSEKLNLLGDIFGKSKDVLEMELMLMNAINKRDIYKYFSFLDKKHILIGEFLMAVISLKQAQNIIPGAGPEGGPGGNILPFRKSEIKKATGHNTSTPHDSDPRPAASAANEYLNPNQIEEA